MVHPSSNEPNTAPGQDTGLLVPPQNPKAVDVQIGVRWVAVSWQPPHTTLDSPVEDYLLAVAPGYQTFRFDADTTQTVLVALAPHQPYTIFVAARNAAGSSGWVSSRPIQLAYSIESPSWGNALINAELFEDLLLLNDATLSSWLAGVDEMDLELAIAATPLALRERIFASVHPIERAQMLRQKLAPPPPRTQIVRRSEVIQPLQPVPQPYMAGPDVVIEIPLSPKRRRLWTAALIPLLLIGFVLIWLMRPLWPLPENTDLNATVGAMVAAHLTSEATQTRAPAIATPLRVALPTLMSTPTLLTPQETPPGEQPFVVYAESAAELLNVRNGPGEVYNVRGILPAGAQVELQGRNEDGSWVYISSEGVEGWVASWWLTVLGNLDDLAVHVSPPTPIPTPELLTINLISPTVELPVQLVNAQVLTVGTGIEAGARLSTPDALTSTTMASTDSPCLMGGHFWLIHPVEITVYDQVSFRWGFSAPLPKECGFEVSVWRVDGSPRGVHDAVADNKNGVVKLSRQNEYRLDVPFMHNLPSVAGSGDYLWTVSIVEIEPTYRSFNRNATPSRFYLEIPSH